MLRRLAQTGRILISGGWRIPVRRALALIGTAVLIESGTVTWRAPAGDGPSAPTVVPVTAQVAGTVVKVTVAERQYVKTGAVLIELDPTGYRAAVTRARARETSARTAADHALTTLSIQERAVNRMLGGLQALRPDVRQIIVSVPVPSASPAGGQTGQTAQVRIEQARRQVAAAQADVLRLARTQAAAAQQTVDRDRTLLAQGLIAQRQLEDDAAALAAAKAQTAEAQTALHRTQAPGPSGVSARAGGPDPSVAAQIGAANAGAAQVTAAQNAVDSAEAGVAAARQTLERDQALLAEGAIPAQQVTADTAAVDGAQARLAAAQAALAQAHAQQAALQARGLPLSRRTAPSRRVAATTVVQNAQAAGLIRQAEDGLAAARQRARTLTAAQQALASAEAATRAAEADLDGTAIRAPADGWVAGGGVKPGETVSPGQPLMSLTLDPRGASGAPAARTITPSQPARTQEQELKALAELEAESARIRAIVVNLSPGARGGPAPVLLGDLLRPVAGAITSGYGWRIHPIFQTAEFHTGVDIAAGWGTPVEAAAGGMVIYTGSLPANGMILILDHGSGLSTTYSHLSSTAVRPGDQVHRGQVIARVGSTGWSTGPHLFFEVRKHGQPVDPLAR